MKIRKQYNKQFQLSSELSKKEPKIQKCIYVRGRRSAALCIPNMTEYIKKKITMVGGGGNGCYIDMGSLPQNTLHNLCCIYSCLEMDYLIQQRTGARLCVINAMATKPCCVEYLCRLKCFDSCIATHTNGC